MEILDEALVIEVNAGSPHLAAMERCIKDLLDDKPEIVCLEKLRKLFNLEFRPIMCTSITIVNSEENEFFAARVIPDVKYLEQIVRDGLDVRRERQNIVFKEYTIEIDRQLIDDNMLTSREILAILLHEIGHTASDAKLFIPRAAMHSVTLSGPIAGAGIGVGIATGNIYAALGGLLVASLLSIYEHGMEYWKNLKIERDADSMAYKCGYGVDLVNALDKIVEFNHNAAANAKTPDIRKMVKYSLAQMAHLRQRQSGILKLFKAQLKDETSPVARDVLMKQISAIEAGQKERKVFGKRIAEEARIENELNESIKTFMEIQSKGLSMLEVDEIEIEIGRIETSDDKLYLAQRIHRAINIANKTKEKLSKSGKFVDKARIEQIDEYIDALKKLLPRVKAVKTIMRPYNITIKYPKGDYEEDEEVYGD